MPKQLLIEYFIYLDHLFLNPNHCKVGVSGLHLVTTLRALIRRPHFSRRIKCTGAGRDVDFAVNAGSVIKIINYILSPSSSSFFVLFRWPHYQRHLEHLNFCINIEAPPLSLSLSLWVTALPRRAFRPRPLLASDQLISAHLYHLAFWGI